MDMARMLREVFKPEGGAGKYDLIQALRFVAALAVVVCHASFYAQERLDPTSFRYNAGTHGVGLFFVISGFVMIIASAKLHGTFADWKQFAMRRIIRIVPMYWLATSIKLVVLLLAANLVLHAKIDWFYILKSYFFVPAINVDNEIKPFLAVGWTLVFEMFFYAIFTLCLLARVSVIGFCTCLFGGLAIASIFKTTEWPLALYFYSNPIVLNFLWGMIAARLIQRGIYMPQTPALIAVIVSLAYLFMFSRVLNIHGTIPCGIASLLVVYGCASLENKIKITVHPALIFLGAASYSTYLFHPIFSPVAPEILKRIGLISPTISVILSTSIAVIAGSVCYVLIENPTTKALNGMIKRPNARARGDFTHAPVAAQNELPSSK